MRDDAPASLFPDEIESDDWTLFHGTSVSAAAAVDERGLLPHSSLATKEMVSRVLAIIEEIDWISSSAVPLISFSQGFDLVHGRSPIFLAETSQRAAGYASEDFAGGEKLSRIRKTIDDLEVFLTDKALREEHYASKARIYERYKGVMHPDQLESLRPKFIDLHWLSEQLDGLGDIRRVADEAKAEHAQGVVLALRLEPDDVKKMVWHKSMGIMTFAHIPASRIVDRAAVPRDFVGGPRADPFLLPFHEKAIASALKPWTIEWSGG
ncbi:hypothetical protein [Sphingopyxis sp. P8]|uniref:hypothetical protein n=1 Tax=Sphingopyxis sp. P8 TaxID=2763256 RepID=UPI001D0A5C15|nr:hypothetical protein [Sphingopyxis sp. P8]